MLEYTPQMGGWGGEGLRLRRTQHLILLWGNVPPSDSVAPYRKMPSSQRSLSTCSMERDDCALFGKCLHAGRDCSTHATTSTRVLHTACIPSEITRSNNCCIFPSSPAFRNLRAGKDSRAVNLDGARISCRKRLALMQAEHTCSTVSGI